jgi:Ni,Fe-hydrogenase III small subunit
MSLYSKILSTPLTLISTDLISQEKDVTIIQKSIDKKIKKLFGGSLAIREVDAGSTNACEQELTALTNTYYDIERFGIHFVASPRHADMLIVTGPVSRNMAEALKKTYEATPDPKVVVAVGNDAIDGGIFKGSYATLDGVHNIIPVNFQIPGDPPSTLTILSSLLYILEIIDIKTKKNNKIK